MASREIKHLSVSTQILYNKFNDRCRRDVWLAKSGIAVVLLCTYRSNEEQTKLYAKGFTDAKPGKSKHNVVLADGTPAAGAFDILPLRYGKPVCETGGEAGEIWQRIREHGEAVGLTCTEPGHFEENT